MVTELVAEHATNFFRTDTSQPGFAIIDLGPELDLAKFRSILIGFYSALDGLYLRDFSRRLLLRSVGRFDQKVTTEPHLDGAPEESILMLGYEPSDIESQLSLIDYTRCADDQGLTPAEYLERFNLRADSTKTQLARYAIDATPFNRKHYRIVIINNSRLPITSAPSGMLGVLHKSTVLPHQSGQTRFINTLLMSAADAWADDLIPAASLRAYIDVGSFATI